MKSTCLALCLLPLILNAQILFTENGNTLHIGENSRLTTSNETVFNGQLDNDGELILGGHIDFVLNNEIGHLLVNGNWDQVLAGSVVSASDLTIDKEGQLIVTVDSLKVQNQLSLTNGIVFTRATDFHLISGNIIGGSEDSFIDGSIRTNPSLGSPYIFPIGRDNEYLPLTIHTPSLSLMSAQVGVPDPTTLIPGDSLIGLADEFEWILDHHSGEPMTSTLSIEYTGVDLMNFEIRNEIRAEIYTPVIGIRRNSGDYQNLGNSQLPAPIESAGNITTLRTINLLDSIAHFSIGVGPGTDGLKFYVPTVFSPDGSMESNRVFREFLIGVELLSHRLTIWNIQNQEVFNEQVQNPDLNVIGWNGLTKGGTPAPQGAYYFEIILETEEGNFSKKGTVLLMR